MAKLGIGVLGYAHGHLNAYSNYIRQCEEADLVICYDHDEERGQRQAEGFEIEYSPHVEDVVNHPQVEAVMVGSETNRHADLCVAAAEAGKSIALQKPMALSLRDCDRIIEAVERNGVKFMMCQQMRHDPMNIFLKELVDSGRLGRIGWLRRRHCLSLLFNPNFAKGPTRWHIDPEANMGMFMDDASHATDFVGWLLGDPVSVTAEIDQVLTTDSPDDSGVALYRFPNKAMAIVIHTSVTWAGENTCEIYGDKGVVIQNHDDGPSTQIKPRHPVPIKLFEVDKKELGWQEDFDFELPETHGARIAGVAPAIVEFFTTDKEPPATARDGRRAVEMILGAYRSAATGQRVQFPMTEE